MAFISLQNCSLRKQGVQKEGSHCQLTVALFIALACAAQDSGGSSGKKEQSATRRDAVLRVLAALLDGAAAPELQPQEDAALAGLAVPDGDRAVPGRMSQLPPQLPQLPPRDRKAPCKNFFWKTFTSC
ncbi:cortistatin isoform X1 [Pithys albifrons albifrons]|uniref:cortistatin isoform X1 n=1 Tax=Pithys albifrons albifrons TaxID=3385563 RepID=UPI003A5CFC7B